MKRICFFVCLLFHYSSFLLAQTNELNEFKRRVNTQFSRFEEICEEHPYINENDIVYWSSDKKYKVVHKSEIKRNDYVYEKIVIEDYSFAHQALLELRPKTDSVFQYIEKIVEMSKLDNFPPDDYSKKGMLDEVINYYESNGIKTDVKVNKVRKDAEKGIINKKFRPAIEAYAIRKINEESEIFDNTIGDYYQKRQGNKEITVITGVKDPTVIYYEINGEKFFNNENPIYLAKWGSDKWAKAFLRKMSEGWEWTLEGDKMKENRVTFPVRATYYISDSHPNYAVIFDNNIREAVTQIQIFNTDGELIRINTVPNNYYGNISELVEQEIYIKWYKENKYNIQAQPQSTLDYIEKKLGLKESKLSAQSVKLLNNALKAKEKVEDARTYKQYKEAKQEYNVAAVKVVADWFSDVNETGNNYLAQLEEDQRDLFGYVYNLERVNDTSIDVYFLSKDGKRLTQINCTYSNERPFKIKRDVKLVAIHPTNVDMDAINKALKDRK